MFSMENNYNKSISMKIEKLFRKKFKELRFFLWLWKLRTITFNFKAIAHELQIIMNYYSLIIQIEELNRKQTYFPRIMHRLK